MYFPQSRRFCRQHLHNSEKSSTFAILSANVAQSLALLEVYETMDFNRYGCDNGGLPNKDTDNND